MSTQDLWPALDAAGNTLTVLEADGVTPVPAGGITLTLPLSAYYQGLCARSLLLTYDPLGGGGGTPVGVPDSTESARIASTLTGLTLTQLLASTDLTDGCVVTTTGRTTAGVGPASYRFREGDVSTADGVRIAAPNNGGRLFLLDPDGTFMASRWGVVNGDTGDQATLLQAMLDLAWLIHPQGKRICIDVGGVVRSTRLNPYNYQTITGENGTKMHFVNTGSNAYGFAVTDRRFTTVRDLRMELDSGVSGWAEITNTLSQQNTLRDCDISVTSPTSAVPAVSFENAAYTANSLRSIVDNVYVDSPNYFQSVAPAFRTKARAGARLSRVSAYVGTIFKNCRVNQHVVAMDINDCDSVAISRPWITVAQTAWPEDPTHAGRCFKFGDAALYSYATDIRCEHYDKLVEFDSQSVSCHVQSLLPVADNQRVVNPTIDCTVSLNSGFHPWVQRQPIETNERMLINGPFELCAETVVTLASSPARNRLIGGTLLRDHPFTILTSSGDCTFDSVTTLGASVITSRPTSGAVHFYYYNAAHNITITHEDTGEATATARVNTLTGADVTLAGPCFFMLISGGTLVGTGTQRHMLALHS